MSLPLWYEKGREFAGTVMDGLQNAAAFRPHDIIDQWAAFHAGSGLAPFDGGDEAAEIIRWCVEQRRVRLEFAQGYRDGMRETRFSRRAARAAARRIA